MAKYIKEHTRSSPKLVPDNVPNLDDLAWKNVPGVTGLMEVRF